MKENLFEAYARMCNSVEFCNGECPMHSISRVASDRESCQKFLVEHTKKAEEIVTKWAEEHPIKTRQDVFLEMYPNAELDEDGVLKVCSCDIDKRIICCINCKNCRKEYWGEEAK